MIHMLIIKLLMEKQITSEALQMTQIDNSLRDDYMSRTDHK